MTPRKITIPNNSSDFVLGELRHRLADGLSVTIAFGGASMLPMIDGNSDKIILEPLPDGSRLKAGDIYLFEYNGRCVVHRLMSADGDSLVFRGDNCMSVERVPQSAVWARLATVVHADGTTESCDDRRWQRRSRRVVAWRNTANAVRRLFSRRQRRWERWLYFVMLLVLMWAPLGGLGVPLNNFVFGIRLDHLLHASVYIPCVFSLMDFSLFARGRRYRSKLLWLMALSIAIVTETVQWLLPYRGFDINDLVANFLGVTAGWALFLLLRRKKVIIK